MGQRERQRERQTKRQTYECAFNYYRHRRNEAERGDRNGNALLPHFSAPKPKWSNNAHARTHAHTLAISHTHAYNWSENITKSGALIKFSALFCFESKSALTHTNTHTVCALYDCALMLALALSLRRIRWHAALSHSLSLSFEIRIKYWVRMSFVADCNVTKKVTTATNTHREQAHTHINTHTRLLL